MCQRVEEIGQREADQVLDRGPMARCAEFRLRGLDEPAVELRASSDVQHMSRPGVQPQRQLQRRRELAFQDHAGDVGGQSSGLEVPAVDAAEDRCRAGEHLGSVREHEVERRPQDGDDHVDPFVGVFRAKVVLEDEPVPFRREAGQIHGLAVHLDRAPGSRRQGPHQTGVEHGESRQVGTLVVEQYDPVLGCRGRGDTQRER